MTKVNGGIESMLSGKFVDMVFVQRNGKTYMRRAPQRKKDAGTPAMLLNQKRFSEVMKFCGQFKTSLIPQVWNAAAEATSGFRLFQKTNSPAFAKDGSLSDPKKLKLSTGTLALPQEFQAERTAHGSTIIRVSWLQDIHQEGMRRQDELMAISAADGNYSELTATGIIRNTQNGTFELPQLPNSATHIYLFFASKDRRDYSESVCFEI